MGVYRVHYRGLFIRFWYYEIAGFFGFSVLAPQSKPSTMRSLLVLTLVGLAQSMPWTLVAELETKERTQATNRVDAALDRVAAALEKKNDVHSNQFGGACTSSMACPAPYYCCASGVGSSCFGANGIFPPAGTTGVCCVNNPIPAQRATYC